MGQDERDWVAFFESVNAPVYAKAFASLLAERDTLAARLAEAEQTLALERQTTARLALNLTKHERRADAAEKRANGLILVFQAVVDAWEDGGKAGLWSRIVDGAKAALAAEEQK